MVGRRRSGRVGRRHRPRFAQPVDRRDVRLRLRRPAEALAERPSFAGQLGPPRRVVAEPSQGPGEVGRILGREELDHRIGDVGRDRGCPRGDHRALGGEVLHELRPPSFGTTPFVKVLEGLCSSMSLFTGLRVDFSGQEQLPPMSNTQAITLYRLVQEGINNVVKHAKAESIWINLEYVDGEVSISLEDDGQGFAISHEANYGIGLDGLRERFLDLGGSLDIESTVGKGTRLYGSLPIAILGT